MGRGGCVILNKVARLVWAVAAVGLIVAGVWQWSPPAAMVTLGCLMLADVVVGGRRHDSG